MNGITLMMMVRDEAQTLAKAIRSVWGIIDEVIIGVGADTVDGTVGEIAALREATEPMLRWKVVELEPVSEAGFAKPLSRLLDLCSGDYVLRLDGHETLQKPELIQTLIAKQPDAEIFLPVLYTSYFPNGLPRRFCQAERLFKNWIGLTYMPVDDECAGRPMGDNSCRQVVHESLNWNADCYLNRDGMVCGRLGKLLSAYVPEIGIDHIQPPAIERRSAALKEKLLLDWLVDHPDDPHAHYFLGAQLLAQRDKREVVQHLEMAARHAPNWQLKYRATFLLSRIAFDVPEEEQRAVNLALELIRLEPDMREGPITLAEIALRRKQLGRAKRWLHYAIQCPQPSKYGYPLEVDYYTYRPWAHLFDIHRTLGEWDLAVQAGEQFLAARPDAQDVRNVVEQIKQQLAAREPAAVQTH